MRGVFLKNIPGQISKKRWVFRFETRLASEKGQWYF
jgi:hypothetical protein